MMKLSEQEIQSKLLDFPNWEIEKSQLFREFKFDSFQQSVDFFLLLARISNELNHHPDFYNSYTYCRVNLMTHDCNGLNELDFEFIRRLENELTLLKS